MNKRMNNKNEHNLWHGCRTVFFRLQTEKIPPPGTVENYFRLYQSLYTICLSYSIWNNASV